MEANNNAKMFEALVMVKKLFDERIMFQPAIREAHKAVNAALAAPPRNCDRFKTKEETALAYSEECNFSLNNQKLREASEQVCAFLEPVRKGMVPKGENLLTALIGVKDALAEPPRNCDRFKTKEEAALAYAEECNAFIPQSVLWQIGEWLDWLFAEAKGGNDEQ